MNKIIGIAGGVGPFAGLNLFKKIFNLTDASTDQQHLDVLLHSLPGRIPDRTAFLIGEGDKSPSTGLFEVVSSLTASSAEIIGVPCNTSHSEKIWGPLSDKVAEKFPDVTLVNMVNEVAEEIKKHHEQGTRVGVMATTGTVASDVYGPPISLQGLAPVYPDEDVQKNFIQDAIYNEQYGIKAFSDPTTDKAREQLMVGINHLISKGAGAIILGCTEIPLSIVQDSYQGVPLYDSTLILAHKLISLVDQKKLKR